MSKFEEEVARIERIYNVEVENAKKVLAGKRLHQQIQWLKEDRDKAITAAERNAKWDVIHIDHAGRRRKIRDGVSIQEANEAFYGIMNTEIVEHEEEKK